MEQIKNPQHHRCVVFTTNSALILVNPIDWEIIQHYPNVVVNPDLSRVIKTKPKYWKLEDGIIMPMAPDEMERRDEEIAFAGSIDKQVRRLDYFGVKAREQKIKYAPELVKAIYMLLAVLSALTLVILFKK